MVKIQTMINSWLVITYCVEYSIYQLSDLDNESQKTQRMKMFAKMDSQRIKFSSNALDLDISTIS